MLADPMPSGPRSSILLNDFRRQWLVIAEDASEAMRSVGESGWYILGERVAAFESQLAAAWGLPCAVGCASGLDAIEIALRGLGLKAGDRVLTTPLSAFATTLAVLRAGGVPVFVDVDANGLLDLKLAADVLATMPDIRFMLPVHLYGQSLDLDALAALAERFELAIVEDCAQAIGASWRGERAGSVGAAAAVSFYPTKNLGALGDGGALLCRDPDLAARARSLRDYGQTSKYRHEILGLNSRLDELHAAVLAQAMLPRLEGWTARRLEIASRYLGAINHPRILLPRVPDECSPVWHIFPLRVTSGRASLIARLAASGVQSAVHYPTLIPDQPALQGSALVPAGLARARAYAGEELSIPIHPFLSEEEVDHVIEAVNGWENE